MKSDFSRHPIPLGARLLQILRSNPLPPTDLAEALGEPVAAIRACVEHLCSRRFEIPLHPLLGYNLQGVPASLQSEDILSRVQVPWFSEIRTLQETTSTNTVAMEEGAMGTKGPIVIFAEHQTAGRGRFGRVWNSGAGEGLWFSVLLHPNAPTACWPRFTTLCALAIAEAVEAITPLVVQIKWPNDLQVGGLKLAGILAETGSSKTNGAFVVIGIGLNVNQTAFESPLSETATSLRMLTGTPVDRTLLAATLLDRLGDSLSRVVGDFEGAMVHLKQRSSVLGRPVKLHVGDVQLDGFAENIDAEGHLLLRLPNGTLQKFAAGEVSLRFS
jgi:BirA family biotin operon repressor/biotin-[acetyl-CoA-carboxylase] ligase